VAVIKEIRFKQVVRPLKTTFATALGKKRVMRSVLVTASTDSGAEGAGEVPTSAAFKNESIGAICRVLKEAANRVGGAEVDGWASLVAGLRADFPRARMTLSGLEVALFRAAIAERGVSEHLYWGGRAQRIETDITLPALRDSALLAQWTDRAVRQGFTAYKLKATGRAERDLETVALVYGLLKRTSGAFRLRIDCNQGYTREGFLAFADTLEKSRYEIELFEQPLHKDDFDGLAYIKGRSHAPIILDESVAGVQDAQRAIDHNLGDGINIKIAKSGIGESMRIMELARRHHMKLMVGCMIETMVGLSAAIFMAAGSGAFDFVDLDAVHFLYGRNDYPGISREGRAFVVRGERR
jgi:L-alanine-DL-glutamate epimerase-like enolase superfamily enzyme